MRGLQENLRKRDNLPSQILPFFSNRQAFFLLEWEILIVFSFILVFRKDVFFFQI